MKKIARKILSFIMTFCCALPISACENKADNNSGTSSCVHTYTSVTTKQPTCKETGIKTYTCASCGNSYTEDIAKLTTHDYRSEITKEATCKETGEKTYTCNICGNSYTEDIAKSTKHSYISEITKEATCKEMGEKAFTCGVCGNYYTEDIAKSTKHSYTSEVTKEASCLETGIKTYTCDECGDSYIEDIAKNENHYLTRNGNCVLCGLNSTVTLNMNETDKDNVSKIAYMNYYRELSTDNSGNYIYKFLLLGSDQSTSLAVPTLIDITITNSNGATIYAKTKEVKSVDYQWENQWGNDYLVASVKVNVDELNDTKGKLSKLYASIYIPGFGSFAETELSVPAIIVMPNLPAIIHGYNSNDKILTGIKITNISYTVNTESYSYLFFSGEKTYDVEGVSYSRGCSIGWKLYDSEDYLIDSGTYYTNALKVGEKFRDDREYIAYERLESGKIYRLELLNVDNI